MKVRRSRSVVDWFKYEKKGPTDGNPKETTLKTDVVLLSTDIREKQRVSTVGVQQEFTLVLERLAVSGKISQINYILDKKIQTETDFSEEETHELLMPIFSMIRRLTYEVSEIILDEPGIDLDFSPHWQKEKRLKSEKETDL